MRQQEPFETSPIKKEKPEIDETMENKNSNSKGTMSFFVNKKIDGDGKNSQQKNGAEYNPDKLKYDPIKDAFWGYGEK